MLGWFAFLRNHRTLESERVEKGEKEEEAVVHGGNK